MKKLERNISVLERFKRQLLLRETSNDRYNEET